MSCRFALAATLFAASAGGFASTCSATQLGDVEHIIVIYLENHSFDNLFGFFPNADGIAAAGATKIQVDADGKPYEFLPQVDKAAGAVDDRFPKDLPNQPFSIDAYVPIGEATGDPIHRFFHQKAQIDGGRMDKFVAYTNMGALPMGFYDGSATKLWDYAKRYTLADHFFQAAFGGSFLNHFWLICACTPVFPEAPRSLVAEPDGAGGFWDHVPPPKIDRWGPSTRIPTVIISPFAKKGFIDHTTYDTTAILKLIELRFGLECLGDRDKKSKDLTNAFDFDGPPPEPVCKSEP